MNKNIINKRKKNIFNLYIVLSLFFVVFFLIFLNFFLDKNKLIDKIKILIEKYSIIYGYTLDKINIYELNYLTEKDILNYFDPYISKSIFLIPLDQIAHNVSQIKWVENIEIKSNFKNSLDVLINEEVPFGIYSNNNQNVLFSENLIALEMIKNINKYNDFTIFFGINSIDNSVKFFENFDNEFKKSIQYAYYIQNRRWDIQLKNNVLLKLPENRINESINNYQKIYSNISDIDMKEIESIDLRFNNKAIIRYREQ